MQSTFFGFFLTQAGCSTDMQAKDLLFARQPILDANNHLYGFELLYRNKNPNIAAIEDGESATAELLVNYCSGILNDDQAPYVKMFINLTDKLLMSEYFFPLEPQRIVIEILESAKVCEQLVNRVRELKQMGYRFALDDYSFDPAFDPLVPLADYIKIDLTHISEVTVKDSIELMEKEILAGLKSRPVFLAEKVETREQYDICRSTGFELFQGYYLERPQLVYGKKISNSSETALQIVAMLQDPEIEVDSLSHAISRDTKLSYQILKIVNSPLCRLPRRVNSLQEAVVLLGLQQIKKWAMAMVLSGNSKAPAELFRILLTRARCCELIAEHENAPDKESWFTVGLFSAIDAVMLADKAWLIQKLELSEDVTQAILSFEGEKGQCLEKILALEQADWFALYSLSDQQRALCFSCHEQAVDWAARICDML